MGISEEQYNSLDKKVDKILAALETQLDGEPGVIEKVRVLWSKRKNNIAWVERGFWLIAAGVVSILLRIFI